MIELLTADTPNGKKVSIMLEEIGFENKVKKGKPWSTTDAVFIDTHGTEVALVRQVAVILPRLTEK